MEEIVIEFDPVRGRDPAHAPDYAAALWDGLGRPAGAARAPGRLEVRWDRCTFSIEFRVPRAGPGQAVIGWGPHLWWFRRRRCRRAAERLRDRVATILWRVRP